MQTLVTWCSGCLEDIVPASGGLLINMECTAIILGPVNASTYANNWFYIIWELASTSSINYTTNQHNIFFKFSKMVIVDSQNAFQF